MRALITILFVALVAQIAQAESPNNCKITTQSEVGATTVSTIKLAANVYRKGLEIQNHGVTTILIKFNSAHTGTEGTSISSTQTWAPNFVPVNSIYLKALSGSTAVGATILECQ